MFKSLSAAKNAIRRGSQIYLFEGVFDQGIYLHQDNLEIIGEKGVVFDGAVTDEKGALVLTGDNILVENIECRNIKVPDLNGACIRFEGTNLTVRDLYVHDSQSGVMTSDKAGVVKIVSSRFERLGGKAKGDGYAHALYIKADELLIHSSKILSTKGEGTGVKSRSKKVVITNSVLASLDGKDSRLVDMANYGELIITNSILQQGENTTNSQLIAYGLEKNLQPRFKVNRIEISNNIVIVDNKKNNFLISHRLVDEIKVNKNILVGSISSPWKSIQNKWYTTRKRAGLPAYPYIPLIKKLENTRTLIGTSGIAEKCGGNCDC